MTTSTTATPTTRARWAAIGAAVAVSLGAGGLGVARATSPDGAAAYVAITPCRLFDTRSDPAFRIGPHGTLAADAQIAVDGWGAQGRCAAPAPELPAGTTGLQLNVTAVGATDPTYLTFFPGNGTRPTASSLNPTPGQPPTPNAVTTQLDDQGRFSVYNRNGTVDVVVDVVGYYVDHEHTGADIADGTLTGADIADESLSAADIADAAGLAGRLTTHNPVLQLSGSSTTVGTVRLRVPADGFVVVFATVTWSEVAGLDTAECEIVRSGAPLSSWDAFRLDDFGGQSNGNATTTAHRAFPVTPADNVGGPVINGQPFDVVCRETNGNIGIMSVYTTALFVPALYNPGSFQG